MNVAHKIISETIAVSENDAVRCSLINSEFAAGYCFRQLPPREFKPTDFVLVSLNDEGRHRHRAQVGPVIARRNVPGQLDNGFWRGAQELIQNPLRHGRRNRRFLAEKQRKAAGHECRSILLQPCDKAFAARPTSRRRRNWTDQHHARDAAPAVTGHITRNFAATHRIADERDVVKIELFDNSGKIPGQRVVIIAPPRILGSAVPASIVGDAAQPSFAEFGELVFPYIRIQCPWMTKNNWWPVTPIPAEQLRAVAAFKQRAGTCWLSGSFRRCIGRLIRSNQRSAYCRAHRKCFHNRSSLHGFSLAQVLPGSFYRKSITDHDLARQIARAAKRRLTGCIVDGSRQPP